MKRLGLTAVVIIVLVVLLAVSGAFYTVNETQQAIKTRFGEPIGDPVTEAGLHFKIPFIDKIHIMEKRLLEWDGYPTEVPTKGKKYIYVDTTARWLITEPLKFYKSVYNEEGAQSKLDDVIDSVVRRAVTENTLMEIVRNTNRLVDVINPEDVVLAEKEELDRENLILEMGREEITRTMLENAKDLIAEYGITLVDVRIKRLNYVESVRKKVYQRMISEREKIASRIRSEGAGRKAEILGKMEKELDRIQSGAYRRAQEVKGKADGEATKIYADAYNKDPEFYSFMQTLDTFSATMKKNSTLILTTDSDFYRYLKSVKP